MTEKEEMKLIVVYEANGELDAEIIKGLLVANGIECFIDISSAPHEIMGMQVNITIPIKVQEKDATAAIDLINTRPPISSEEGSSGFGGPAL